MKYLDLPAECMNCKNLYIKSYTFDIDENEVITDYACANSHNLEPGLGLCDFQDPLIAGEVTNAY